MIVSLSPIPCLVLVLLIECIPLADPALGWRSSGAFQVRMLATNMLGSATSLYERAEYLPEFKITWQRAVIFSTGVASMNFFTSCTVMVAADIFPVPFSAFVGAIPAAVTAEVILRAFARDSGPQASGSASPGHARRLRTVQNLQLVQMLLTVVYPVYTAVFSQLSARQQLWFSLVLVLLRLGVRALQWRVSHDDEDLAGVISSASGHLFHVLFSLTCLQNAKSIDTLAVVLAFNTLQTLLNCRLLVRGSSRLPGSKRGGEDLSAVMGMIADDSFVRALDRIDPTIVLSTYHRYQDVRFRALHTPPQYTTEQAANKPKRTRRCCSRRRVHPTRPEPQGGPSTEMRARVNSKAMHRASNSFVGAGSDLEQAARALEACEMFHHCEAVLLRSYVTTIMILIHGKAERGRRQRRYRCRANMLLLWLYWTHRRLHHRGVLAAEPPLLPHDGVHEDV